MEENHFDVNIFSVLVQEVLQEVRHRLIGDVATDHDVPGENTKSLRKSDLCNVVDFHAPYMTCRVQTLKNKEKTRLVMNLFNPKNEETEEQYCMARQKAT